jgi:hypothetical protein
MNTADSYDSSSNEAMLAQESGMVSQFDSAGHLKIGIRQEEKVPQEERSEAEIDELLHSTHSTSRVSNSLAEFDSEDASGASGESSEIDSSLGTSEASKAIKTDSTVMQDDIDTMSNNSSDSTGALLL